MSATSMERARAAWGKRLPDWVAALARACDEAASQGKVAKRLGKSTTVINQVLGNKYPSKLSEFEGRVRGEFMRATVLCPVLREISTRRCQDEQTRPFSTSSRISAELYRECAKCPNRMEP
jgi:hypothetical protein